jgi:hypothetical protein
MNRFLGFLLVLAVIVVALGAYLGWFQFGKSSDSSHVNVSVRVDKDKIAQDEKKAEQKLGEIGRDIKKTGENVVRDIRGEPKPAPPPDAGAPPTNYANEARGKLDALEVRLGELKAQVAQKSDDAKAALQKKLNELTAKKDQARRDLAELQTATTDKAEAAKVRLQAALEDLQKSCDRLAAELK